MQRLIAKDPAALTELYETYSTLVYSLACRICRDETHAEEATQDVFVQAWRDAHKYDARRGAIRAWLVIMARARSLDRIRSRRRVDHCLTPLDDAMAERLATSPPSPEAAAVDNDEAGRLHAAMQVLPSDDRLLLELAYFQGLTYPEIANRLTQPLGTVKTRIRRVLGLLRRAIAEHGVPFIWTSDRDDAVPPAESLAGVEVMVLDGDSGDRELTTLVLRRAGARVVAVSSAAAARRRLGVVLPDVLVADPDLPERDGHLLPDMVRRLAGGERVALVAFTGSPGGASARYAGFVLQLPKPIRPSTMIAGLVGLGRHFVHTITPVPSPSR